MASLERYEITRGDARELTATLTLINPATQLPEDWDVPVGATVKATGKRRHTDADVDAIWAKETGTGIAVATNVATITLDAADTDELATGNSAVSLYCDVQVSGPGIGPWTVKQFILVVTPDVTRTP